MDVKTSRETAVAKRPEPDFTDQLIEPFNQLRNEVDRIFDSFPFRLPTLRLSRFTAAPAVEMTETEKAYKIRAELAGMDPENVEVSFEDGLLRIAGEKKEQREETERGYRLSERTYGSFERLIELPSAAEGDKIQAKFKNGLLTVTVSKNDKSKTSSKRIRIDKEA
jgi:HSP20 family protein